MRRDLIRAVWLSLLMAAASALAYMVTPRTFQADQYPREKIADIVPRAFGDWQIDTSIVPVPPSPDLQAVLDATYDETVTLTYRNAAGRRIMLSVAYGRNQHKGMNTHKPEICYPAQGFRVTQAPVPGTIDFQGRSIAVTRLVAQAGNRQEPITYWLMVGDEITQFGYPQRWVAIRYGLAGLIPDGVLVRVSSVDADVPAAYALQEAFVHDLLRSVSPARLPRLLGKS